MELSVLSSPFLLGEVKMRTTWPLFWCLKPEAQALLMKYQWDNHGFRLQVPPLSDDGHIDTKIESPEEIDKLMRQKPRYFKGTE